MQLRDLDMQRLTSGRRCQSEMAQLAAALVQQAPLPDTVQLSQRVHDGQPDLLGSAIRIRLCATSRFGNDSVDYTQPETLARPPDPGRSRRGDTRRSRTIEPAGGIQRVFKHVDPIGNGE